VNKILFNNTLREYIRDAFPEADTFVFEHLTKGFFNIHIIQGDCEASLTSTSGDTIEQNQLIGDILIAKLQERLRIPLSPLKRLVASVFADSAIPDIDLTGFEVARANVTAECTEEEKQEDTALDTRMRVLNRKWLWDNDKILQTTAQNTKFHELANAVRLSGPIDLDGALLIAFETTILIS
jgi:hypothetical protein